MAQLTRRSLLRSGGVLLGGGLAGCVEQLTPPGTDTPEAFQWPQGEIRPFETVTIGDRAGVANPEDNRPHSLVLWNDLDGERPVRIQIAEGDVVRFDETQTFPRNEALKLDLLEPGVYQVRIYFGDGVRGQFMVPRTQFDCNTSVTEIRLPPRGPIQRRTVSTEIGCRPRISQTRFLIADRVCGGGDAARIRFDSADVSVRGRIEAPTPCHGAVLADTEVLAGERTLRIDVELTPPLPNETCVKCIGGIDYRAMVRLEQAGLSTVRVYHEGTEVARRNR